MIAEGHSWSWWQEWIAPVITADQVCQHMGQGGKKRVADSLRHVKEMLKQCFAADGDTGSESECSLQGLPDPRIPRMMSAADFLERMKAKGLLWQERVTEAQLKLQHLVCPSTSGKESTLD